VYLVYDSYNYNELVDDRLVDDIVKIFNTLLPVLATTIVS